MQELNPQVHSTAWVIQAWVSFMVAVAGTAVGIFFMPGDIWLKGFLGMGLAFSIGSTFNVAKTTRDLYEAKRRVSQNEV